MDRFSLLLFVRRAVLALPVSFSGWPTYLTLDIPTRSHVVQVLTHLSKSLTDIDEYCTYLLNESSSDSKYLFLSSNMSASGYMSQESEVLLYIQIINEIVPHGSTIYIKPHIRSPLSTIEALCYEIRNNYNVILINDNRFSRLPLELWQRLCILALFFLPFLFLH